MADPKWPTARRSTSFARSSTRIIAAGRHGGRVATRFPPGAERLSPHRPREVDLPEFRRRRGARRHLQSAFRRHESDEGGRRVRRRDQGGRRLARLRVDANCSSRRTTSSSSTQFAVQSDRGRQGVRRQPDGRRDSRAPRHADRAGPQQPVSRSAGGREPRSLRADAGRRVPGRRSTCCAPRSTWRRRTSTCAIRRCTGFVTPRITEPATPGASIRCTTSRTRCRTPSRASRTRSARWSSRIIGRCTTGWWRISSRRIRTVGRSRSSSRA